MAINGVQRKEVVLLADKPARCNVDCANILTHDGCSLQWVAELRYLGFLLLELVHSGVRSIMPNALSLVRLTAYLENC